MIAKSINNVFDQQQRQSLVINASASMVAVLLLALLSLVVFIMIRGSTYFWPLEIYTITYTQPASQTKQQSFAQARGLSEKVTFETNGSLAKDINQDQNWLLSYIEGSQFVSVQALFRQEQVLSSSLNPDVAELVLVNGNMVFAIPVSIQVPDNPAISMFSLDDKIYEVNILQQQIDTIRKQYLSPLHQSIADLNQRGVAKNAPANLNLTEKFLHYQRAVGQLQLSIADYQLNVIDAEGLATTIPLIDIQRITFPNQLSILGKTAATINRVWLFISDKPKQANSAGGIFPALFGTILMVLLMTLIVTPFGVLAAVYLSEYAPSGLLTTVLRIGVSNMAGVPSIVYGVFGLGFFVYAIGGSIDNVFYSQDLPSPTFGSPGLFWASLTMALLTLPVVVVATEEGLQRVPKGIRLSSYALGATKIETIWYTVLPIASPGIMTGIILSIARAAGEVAPLMLVGAVKFAPALPVDGDFPFLHLDRQFMHLGVFIYDGAFHSQTKSQGSSMMFAACLLLLLCVFVLNLIAINLRSRLRRQYSQV
jgi:phosphate transport system permease protein